MSDQKAAIVTAGGSGMGADAARQLAEDGFNIAVLSSSGKGQALAEELGGSGKIVLFSGFAGSGPAEDRLKGAMDVFKDYPGIEILGQQYADWSPVKAKEIMQAILDADDRILAEPEPLIAVSELADSSVNFVVRPWVSSSDYWPVKFDLTERIKNAFDENGISIPYPQMDVHVATSEAA